MKIGKFVVIIIAVLLLEGGILLGMSAILPERRVYGGTKQRDKAVEAAQQDVDGDGKTSQKAGKWEKKAQEIYEGNKKILVLVNASHELSQDYDPKLRTICNGRLQASGRLKDALVDMLQEASEEGYQFWIASAWRSREKQQKLVDDDVQEAMRKGMSYEEALQETYKETMPAGYSEHETGLALDILCAGNTVLNKEQEKEPGNRWLRKNSWRYGFILRYPSEKEKVTGIRYEPWHFRYVGKKAAAYMHKYDLTLEEFWKKIQK